MVRKSSIDLAGTQAHEKLQSIRTAMDGLRQISRDPFSVQFLSLEETYNFFIEIIDSLRLVRFTQDQIRFWRKLNKGMKEVPPSYDNVGGLISIKIRENPEILLSLEEKTFLNDLQIKLIMARDAIKENDLLTLLQLQLSGNQEVKAKLAKLQEPKVRHRNAGRRVRNKR